MGLFRKKISVHSQLINFLSEIKFNNSIIEDSEIRTIILVKVFLTIGNCDSYFIINHSQKMIEFIVQTPHVVPEKLRKEVGKFLNLADYNTFIGNLQIDHSNGLVRCKTHFVYDNEVINSKIIEANFYSGYFMVEHYYPGIMKIIYGNKDAESAFREINEIINPRDN